MQTKQRNKLVHTLSYDHRNRTELFLEQEIHDQIEVILLLSKHVQTQLVRGLNDDQLVELVDHLDPDDATDILQLLSKKRQQQILERLSEHLKQSVATLLNFDPETAAGLMNINYVQVSADERIEEVVEDVKKHEKRTGRIPTILVQEEGKLKGYVPLHQLAFAKANDKAIEYVKKVQTISHTEKSKDVIRFFRSHPHSRVVVVGEKEQVLGVLFTDDILKLIQSNEAASLYGFAGVSNEESIFDSTGRKVQYRYKWLIINLATAFLAAFTVGLFDETISKHVLLAVYMPIVAGMGGNAATQTLAVMVRGLSQNNIGFSNIFLTLKNEISAGLINGVINGVIVTAVVYFLNRDLMVGLVLGSAMIFNLFIAGTFGTLVPVVMKKLGKDPASSATIFITTATDVFGFLAFLGLATLLLH